MYLETRVCVPWDQSVCTLGPECVYLDVELLGHQAGAQGQATAVPLEEGLDLFQALLERHLHTHQTSHTPSDPRI